MDHEPSLIVSEQLRSAREALALSIEEVAAVIRIPEREVAAWEAGHVQPPLEHLWKLSELYCRSMDYFVRRTEPFPKELAFRLARGKSMSDLSIRAREVLARFDELCRAENELERLLEEPKKEKVPKMPERLSSPELARRVRERLNLASRPIKDLRKLLNDQGVRVFELAVPENEFAGFSWWHPDYGPSILVNAGDSSGRRNFTLAHEYFHLLYPDLPSLCADPLLDIGEDRLANSFAAAFLMPEDDVREEVARRGVIGIVPNEAQLGSLARRYGVSIEALARRLAELQLLAVSAVDFIITELASKRPFYKRPKAPTWRRRLGEAYVARAFKAHSEGLVSLGRLAEYLGVDLRTTASEARSEDSLAARDNAQ